ncbi:MAG: cytochrome c oxidase subunit II [Ardenticatenaceae bacterium]|nr:cytochrome c oxidase subunit II [Ardenticatenaceae bacterium]
MGKAKHYIAVTVLVILATVFLRLLVLGPIYRLPIAASAQAGPIDTMFSAHFWMISFLFALIMVFMLYSVFVFRRKEGDNEMGPYIHGNAGLEIAWTIIPTMFVVGFGIWGAVTLNQLTKPNPDEMTIQVWGQQWAWLFQYPEQDGITTPELVLPVNQPVVLEMESRDVLHSFWIPEFRVKQDLLPGRKTYLRITPTEVGTYKVRCAEICGLQHSIMLADVRVVDQSEFTAWADELMAAPAYADLTPAARGEIWYTEFGCNACHSLDGSVLAGPSWQGIYGHQAELADGTTATVDDAYIRESILNPNQQIVAGFAPNVMPQDFETRMAEKEADIAASQGADIDIINDITAFMQTIEQ